MSFSDRDIRWLTAICAAGILVTYFGIGYAVAAAIWGTP